MNENKPHGSGASIHCAKSKCSHLHRSQYKSQSYDTHESPSPPFEQEPATVNRFQSPPPPISQQRFGQKVTPLFIARVLLSFLVFFPLLYSFWECSLVIDVEPHAANCRVANLIIMSGVDCRPKRVFFCFQVFPAAHFELGE